MEELQEADVLWPDARYQRHRPDCHRQSHSDHQQQPQPSTALEVRHGQGHQSAPVRIPAAPPAEAVNSSTTTRHSWAHGCDDDTTAVDEAGVVIVRRASGADAVIVPPHVLVARRCAAERGVASSVCVGHGRTLKGRDLRAVRNAVLHMTGFLEDSETDLSPDWTAGV